MLEIVHDMAPGAELGFATAFTSDAAFADNIRALRFDAGCDVIADDVVYYNESPFQDGPIAQSVNAVTADGALYFSSAGNEGNTLDGTSANYENDFRGSGRSVGKFAGEAHDFDPGPAVQVFEPISDDSSASVPVTLHWADPLGAAADDYDLYLFNAAGTWSTSRQNVQDGDDDPYEVFSTRCSAAPAAARGRALLRAAALLPAQRRSAAASPTPRACPPGSTRAHPRALRGCAGVQHGRRSRRRPAAVRPRAGRPAEPARPVPGRVHRRAAARALHLGRPAADVLRRRRRARAADARQAGLHRRRRRLDLA